MLSAIAAIVVVLAVTVTRCKSLKNTVMKNAIKMSMMPTGAVVVIALTTHVDVAFWTSTSKASSAADEVFLFLLLNLACETRALKINSAVVAKQPRN